MVAIGALGGMYLYLVVAALLWQVSMVMTAFPTGILAAPQQSPVSQTVLGSLFSLKVPFDRAFSHLDPALPLAGAAAALASRSFSMAVMASFLAF